MENEVSFELTGFVYDADEGCIFPRFFEIVSDNPQSVGYTIEDLEMEGQEFYLKGSDVCLRGDDYYVRDEITFPLEFYREFCLNGEISIGVSGNANKNILIYSKEYKKGHEKINNTIYKGRDKEIISLYNKEFTEKFVNGNKSDYIDDDGKCYIVIN